MAQICNLGREQLLVHICNPCRATQKKPANCRLFFNVVMFYTRAFPFPLLFPFPWPLPLFIPRSFS